LAVASCASVKVGATYDRTVDFSKFTTFAFRADRQIDDPVRQRQAEAIITETLAAKGLRLDAEKPDLLIGLSPFGEAESTGGYLPTGSVVWSTWGTEDVYRISIAGQESKAVEVGMSVRDAVTKRKVWDGVARGRLVYGDPEGNNKKFIAGLRKLLAGFPPKQK
jgi:hypothetical protein